AATSAASERAARPPAQRVSGERRCKAGSVDMSGGTFGGVKRGRLYTLLNVCFSARGIRECRRDARRTTIGVTEGAVHMARRTKEEALSPRIRILDTAERLFERHGVSRTSLQDIAEAAGVTRGAIY